MKDLYAILGLEKGAVAEQIKRAYRKKVKTTHPDTGGDRKKFDEVQMAYDVLNSPDRRAHYDATGEIEPERAENTTARLMEVIASALFEVLTVAEKEKIDYGQVRFLDAMRSVIENVAAKVRQNIAGHIANRTPLEKVAERFSVQEGKPDHIGQILRSQLSGIAASIAIDEERLETLDLAKQYLADCKYRNDPAPMQKYANQGGFGQQTGGFRL